MKVRNRFKAAAGLSLALFMGMSTQASASQAPVDVNVYQIPMHFTFDGKEYAPSEGQQGFIYEGSTYVPIRFISYSLDKAVKWDADTYTVTIAEPKEADKININEYKINAQVNSKSNEKLDKAKLVSSKLNVYKEKIAYVFDGLAKSPSENLPGYIVDGSLYVPIRFFSESVGKTINWDPETYTVSAVTAPEKKDPEVKLPEVPKPDPMAPAVGGGGGPVGAGGGGTFKPSLDSIKSDTEAKLKQLEAKSSEELHALYDQYRKTQDPNLIVQALTKISQVDSEFNQIINDTDTKLTSSGYDKSIIDSITDTYKEKYKQAKTDAKNAIISK